jgi:hypothetical protein
MLMGTILTFITPQIFEHEFESFHIKKREHTLTTFSACYYKLVAQHQRQPRSQVFGYLARWVTPCAS